MGLYLELVDLFQRGSCLKSSFLTDSWEMALVRCNPGGQVEEGSWHDSSGRTPKEWGNRLKGEEDVNRLREAGLHSTLPSCAHYLPSGLSNNVYKIGLLLLPSPGSLRIK